MKIRNDFVSNSSSSSYIIIVNSGLDMTSDIINKFSFYSKEWNEYSFPNEEYKHEFGWEFEDTCTFGGKLNFIGIQLLYLLLEKIENNDKKYERRPYTGKDFDRLYDMVKKVCLEKFKFHVKLNEEIIKTKIFYDDKKGYYTYIWLNDYFYIDHQSASSEGSCMEMFNSEEDLYNFLRFNGSFIQGGNDNT